MTESTLVDDQKNAFAGLAAETNKGRTTTTDAFAAAETFATPAATWASYVVTNTGLTNSALVKLQARNVHNRVESPFMDLPEGDAAEVTIAPGASVLLSCAVRGYGDVSLMSKAESAGNQTTINWYRGKS